jgi:hypothetical protein
VKSSAVEVSVVMERNVEGNELAIQMAPDGHHSVSNDTRRVELRYVCVLKNDLALGSTEAFDTPLCKLRPGHGEMASLAKRAYFFVIELICVCW